MQLCEEGISQVFTRITDSKKIIGTVGVLQFDVIKYRLENEYGAQCRFENLNYIKASWLNSENHDLLEQFVKSRSSQIAIDKDQNYVFMAETQWSLDREISENSNISFHFSSEY